jgi:hypothetical protein
MTMKKEKRAYPRIQSDWRLFLAVGGLQKPIGYVKDISLTGALLFFTEEYELDPDKHRFTLKFKNPQLDPSELVISGLKEWEKREKNEIFLGITLEKLEKEKRTVFIHFLSRSDKLQAQAFLLEVA